ncbi:hypothetical protein NPX13_g5313 [Xylaria arbuscula]|uniref:Uncharacterized protein n=1 Tax=Xylaria arbuscula TaxID=114810 RepID=A0A9W8TMI6_9PEZI|nr:hypothetical protein NPX13_g5313 [Xylaria arbuscula]
MSRESTKSEPGGFQSTAPSRNLVEHITWSAGAALVFGAIVCYSATKQSELPSELLCWVLLPVVFAIAKRRREAHGSVESLLPLVKSISQSSETQTPSSISLWMIAASIVICSVFRAERGIIILLPALAPLLAISYRYTRPGSHPSTGCHISFSSLLRHDILGTALTAVLGIAALSGWDPTTYAISAAPVVALFIAYTLLAPQSTRNSQWLESVDIEDAVSSLALRVAALLVAALVGESYLFGLPNINAVETLALGLIKALMWYFTSQLARNTSWLVAAVAGTFSLLATRDPFMQPTDTRALIVALASLLSLVQVLYLLPKQAKARLTLLGLAAIPLVPYLSNLAALQLAQSSALKHAEKHPVEVLTREANANFDNLLRNQSSTYAAAHAEYQRRYGFEPPDGFEQWYKFAKENESPIIDEFDIISEGITPFLRMSGQEFLDIMSVAYDEPDHELWSCVMSGQPAKTECSHHGRENDRNNAHFFDRVTEKIPVVLKLRLLLNHLDEPTVMIPPLSAQSIRPVITNRGGERAWEVLTEFCSLRKNESKSEVASTIETYGLPFVTDRKAAMDLCQHPEYSDTHGLLAAPESLRLTEGLVPVLSNGAPSTMGDILYPSTAYVEEDRFAYHAERDIDWDKKQNNLYWAGSTTGGHARPGNWNGLQRQRFVELAQNLKHRTFSYLREKSGGAAAVLHEQAVDKRESPLSFATGVRPRWKRDQWAVLQPRRIEVAATEADNHPRVARRAALAVGALYTGQPAHGGAARVGVLPDIDGERTEARERNCRAGPSVVHSSLSRD